MSLVRFRSAPAFYLPAGLAGLLLAAPMAGVTPAAAGAQPSAPAPAGRRVNLSFRNTPFRQAVETLFRDSGIRFTVEENVPNIPVTLSVQDVSIPVGMRLLMRVAAAQVPGLTARQEADTYVVRVLRPSELPAVEPLIHNPRTARPDPRLEKKVVVRLRRVPLSDALEQLFEGTGVQHIVEPTVPDIQLTLNLGRVPVREGFEKIVRAAAARIPGLYSYREEGNIYYVGLRRVPARR